MVAGGSSEGSCVCVWSVIKEGGVVVVGRRGVLMGGKEG